MKFKIDENLPAECAALLLSAGFPAETVDQEHLSGADDTVLFARCVSEQRVLVTLDLDFANVRAYPPDSHAGDHCVALKISGQAFPDRSSEPDLEGFR